MTTALIMTKTINDTICVVREILPINYLINNKSLGMRRYKTQLIHW